MVNIPYFTLLTTEEIGARLVHNASRLSRLKGAILQKKKKCICTLCVIYLYYKYYVVNSTNTKHAGVVTSHTHLSSGETHVLPHLLGHLHGLLGHCHIELAKLEPLLWGGCTKTMTTLDILLIRA